MSCLSVCLSFWLWASSQAYSSSQGRRHGATIGGGGRGPFEVDSFHAPPIRIMLKAEKFAGDRSPPLPPVPPPMAVRQFTQIPRLVLFVFSVSERLFSGSPYPRHPATISRTADDETSIDVPPNRAARATPNNRSSKVPRQIGFLHTHSSTRRLVNLHTFAVACPMLRFGTRA